MQWHQLDHMQAICTSLQTDNHTNTPSLNCYRPDALPDAQPTLATSTQYRSCQSTSAAWTGAQQQTSRTLLLLLINVTCLGHWVTGSMGHFGLVIFHVRAIRSPFWPGVRPEFFRFLKKMPKMQNVVHLKCWNEWQKSLSGVCCWTEIIGCQFMQWTFTLPMIIKNSLAWDYFFTHKSTFGVHYRTGSLGQLGLRVARFPGHKM